MYISIQFQSTYTYVPMDDSRDNGLTLYTATPLSRPHTKQPVMVDNEEYIHTYTLI